MSLIVSTRNRATRLPDFLARISSLDAPRGGWELILVDNASSDDTSLILERFAATAAFPVRCVRAATPGLSHARNAGLACARGEIIAFTDDDCYPRQDYLGALVEVFEDDRLGVVGGRTLLHDASDARVGVKDLDTPLDLGPRVFVPAGFIHGANMAVRREVLGAIGGFDPLLGAGTSCMAGEDTEYIARAVWAGWRGRYDPRPIVAHHHGRKPGREADQQKRGYDCGRGAYYAKFVLDARSRRVYLAEWYRRTARPLTLTRLRRLRRELVGAVRYLTLHFARREPIQEFDGSGPGRE